MVARLAFYRETYNRTAPSFDNPDFVDVVIQLFTGTALGNAPGDPRFAMMEQQLAKRPKGIRAVDLCCMARTIRWRGPPADSPPSARCSRRYGAASASGRGHFLPARETGSGFNGAAGTAGGDEVAQAIAECSNRVKFQPRPGGEIGIRKGLKMLYNHTILIIINHLHANTVYDKKQHSATTAESCINRRLK